LLGKKGYALWSKKIIKNQLLAHVAPMDTIDKAEQPLPVNHAWCAGKTFISHPVGGFFF
jgi:hypothetical protein